MTGILSGAAAGGIVGGMIDLTAATGGVALLGAAVAGGAIGSGVGNIIDQVGNQVAEGESVGTAIQNVDAQEVAVARNAGAITGALTGGSGAIMASGAASTRAFIANQAGNLNRLTTQQEAGQIVGIIHTAARNSASTVALVEHTTTVTTTVLHPAIEEVLRQTRD